MKKYLSVHETSLSNVFSFGVSNEITASWKQKKNGFSYVNGGFSVFVS